MYGFMKRFIVHTIILFLFINIYSQEITPYQKGATAEKNLNTIANVAPYSPGGVGFDNRYEGIKGSPRLFDKLQPALLWIKNDTNYFKLNADLDVFQNRLIFRHPKTGNLMALPSVMVREVIITVDGKEQKYRTILKEKFDNEVKKERFYQILNERILFIRIPAKIFNEADYKSLYSPDRRYDEYELKYQYYYLGSDSVYHKVQPTQKTLIKLFPDNKDLIESTIKGKKYSDNDEMIQKVLEKINDISK
jgi:hypothetical protein